MNKSSGEKIKLDVKVIKIEWLHEEDNVDAGLYSFISLELMNYSKFNLFFKYNILIFIVTTTYIYSLKFSLGHSSTYCIINI